MCVSFRLCVLFVHGWAVWGVHSSKCVHTFAHIHTHTPMLNSLFHESEFIVTCFADFVETCQFFSSVYDTLTLHALVPNAEYAGSDILD